MWVTRLGGQGRDQEASEQAGTVVPAGHCGQLAQGGGCGGE